MKPIKSRREIAAKDFDLCSNELDGLISSKNFSLRFRPIVSLKSCLVFGHIVRVYGPPDSSIRDMAYYFALARQLDQLGKLSKIYFEAVLTRFKASDVTGCLLLPLPPECLDDLDEEIAHLLTKALKKHEFPAQRIVLVYPGGPESYPASKSLMKELRRLDVGLAAQGIGCALDESPFLADWMPALLMLDESHFTDEDIKSSSLESLGALIQGEAVQGRQVLAQGIDTLSQFHLIGNLGVELAAGDFFGKYSSSPYDRLPAVVVRTICNHNDCECGVPQQSDCLLERLLIKRAPVSPETLSEEVFRIFESELELRAIAVVEDNLPVGLISRYELIDNMARPFRHELYGRRSCSRFMDPEPLIMDVGIHLPGLTDMVVRANPRHLVSGFIVTENGHYLGIGSVQDLMREISAMQMEAARYANPLTQLPGNVAINQTINDLLESGTPFTVAYCDLDHFKPFNDVYGYAKGDEIILLSARILSDAVAPHADFIGHVGGDDFVLVFFNDPDWKARCEQALKRFEEEVLNFFSPEDIERKGYFAPNRKEEIEFCSLVSMSIGVVEIAPGTYTNHLAVAAVAAEVKKKSKAMAGNSLYIDQRKAQARSPT